MQAATASRMLLDRTYVGLSGIDAEILQAAAEVDRTLIQLALKRSLRERLRAGASLARLAAGPRFSPRLAKAETGFHQLESNP